uniref:Uncharacterized protein n=1 Tax=Onchocerca volvulus TaxID=6282 RepID=A0A8R1TV07_ONCVO
MTAIFSREERALRDTMTYNEDRFLWQIGRMSGKTLIVSTRVAPPSFYPRIQLLDSFQTLRKMQRKEFKRSGRHL